MEFIVGGWRSNAAFFAEKINKKAPSSPSLLGTIVAVWLIAVGVGMVVVADIGLAPYDLFVQFLGELLGLTFGQSAWLVSGILILVGFILGGKVSLMHLLYLGLFGFLADFSINTFEHTLTTPESWFMGLSGFIMLVAGVALQTHIGLIGGGYEVFISGLSRWIKNPVRARFLLDLIFFIVPVLIMGPKVVGAGTLLFVFGTPLVLRYVLSYLGDLDTGRQGREKKPLERQNLE